MNDTWSEEIAKNICSGLFGAGAMKFLSDSPTSPTYFWSVLAMIMGGVGLLTLFYVRYKRGKSE